MRSREPSPRQQKALSFVEVYWREHQYAPSLAQIASALEVQKVTAHRYLMALKRKGVLVHEEGQGRSWRPIHMNMSYRIPLLGEVAAGAPILARENIEDWIFCEKPNQSDVLFALRVRGESMIEAGILDRDIVIIRQQEVADNGDLVLALVDDEDATIKRFKKLDEMNIQLIPENSSMSIIEIASSRVFIQGVVVEVRRKLSRMRGPDYDEIR